MPKTAARGELKKLANETGHKYATIHKDYSQGRLDFCIQKNGKINKKKYLSEISDRKSPTAQAKVNQRWSKKNNPTDDEVKNVIVAADLSLDTSISEATRLKAVYDAGLKKLEYEQKNGMLVDFEQVKKEVYEAFKAARDAILNIPNRETSSLMAVTDPQEFKRKLTEYLRRPLIDLQKTRGITE